MSEKKIKYNSLPIYYKYNDQLELVEKLLKIYSVNVIKLTNKNIDLLTLLLIYGINNENIVNIALESKKFTSKVHITTEFSRLKSIGVVKKHSVHNKKEFSGGVEKINELINTNSKNYSIQLFYEKK